MKKTAPSLFWERDIEVYVDYRQAISAAASQPVIMGSCCSESRAPPFLSSKHGCTARLTNNTGLKVAR